MAPRFLLVLAALACALGSAPAASADGDPASDVLVQDDVFLPTPGPAPAVASRLKSTVESAYAHGYRLKVAVIATPTDLGAIPSLFGEPAKYAQFLGSELSFFYVGPLLIVMPGGFGIYDGGRTTAAEAQVLARQKVAGSSPDDLATSGAAAAQALVATGALRSTDITPPYVQPLPATAKRGHLAQLPYYIGDDGKRAAVAIQVLGAGKPVTIRIGTSDVSLGELYHARWPVPATVRPGVIEYCVRAVDASGNRSPQTCAKLTIRR